ncbi:MAG: hypothetical protein AB1Z98_23520 [Nannocystaceae bacterium]
MKRAHKDLTSAAFVLAIAAPLVGCTDEPPGGGDRLPYRDEWRVVADLDFVHTTIEDGDEVVQISDITIGGREANDNFANRGDVIVDFNGMSNRIVIEMRRFTQTTSEDAADIDFENLSLWAFNASLGRPQDQDEEDDCVNSGWQSGCEVRVYYDGLSQLSRAGADIRVTLPPEYRYTLNIETEDNVADADYFNRGDVCVSNLFATANITPQSGNVWVTFNPNTSPTPICSDEDIARCEGWTNEDEMGNDVAAPWDPACGCINHGALDVTNRDSSASNITVDIPSNLWTSIRAENTGEMQQTNGEFCEAVVELPGNLEYDATGNDFPWQVSAAANYPGEPAVSGAGYFVSLESSECVPVAYTPSPGDFVGLGNGDDQESEERGNIRVCNGCITQTCDQLIP